MTDPNLSLVSILPCWAETRPEFAAVVFAVTYQGKQLAECDALLIVISGAGPRSIRVFHEDPNDTTNAAHRACVAAQSLLREGLS
jgi:hypothetical protein